MADLTKDQPWHIDLLSIGGCLGIEDVDADQELRPVQARKLLSYVLANGEVIYSPHARSEMMKDDILDQDVVNVLRAGRIFEPAEMERESWRYRCHTEKFCVVITFDSTTCTVIVTAWRKK